MLQKTPDIVVAEVEDDDDCGPGSQRRAFDTFSELECGVFEEDDTSQEWFHAVEARGASYDDCIDRNFGTNRRKRLRTNYEQNHLMIRVNLQAAVDWRKEVADQVATRLREMAVFLNEMATRADGLAERFREFDRRHAARENSPEPSAVTTDKVA